MSMTDQHYYQWFKRAWLAWSCFNKNYSVIKYHRCDSFSNASNASAKWCRGSGEAVEGECDYGRWMTRAWARSSFVNSSKLPIVRRAIITSYFYLIIIPTARILQSSPFPAKRIGHSLIKSSLAICCRCYASLK